MMAIRAGRLCAWWWIAVKVWTNALPTVTLVTYARTR
jgi:hypothetical protein